MSHNDDRRELSEALEGMSLRGSGSGPSETRAPNENLPSSSSSRTAPPVPGGRTTDTYGCDIERDSVEYQGLPGNVVIDHYGGRMDQFGRYLIRKNNEPPVDMGQEYVEEMGTDPFVNFIVHSTHGELVFQYGSLAYQFINMLIKTKIMDTYFPELAYPLESLLMPVPYLLTILNKLGSHVRKCGELLQHEQIEVPVEFYNHLLYLSDEAEKLEKNVRRHVSRFGESRAAHDWEDVVEEGETSTSTNVAPPQEQTSTTSEVEKKSFASVAALKPPSVPKTSPKPTPTPVEIELHVTENKSQTKSKIETKKVATPPEKEVRIDPEGYRAPKKPAPKMEMTSHKMLPVGSSSSSESSNSSESVKSASSTNKFVFAEKREAARKAAEKAQQKAEAALREKLSQKLTEYKQHLESGRQLFCSQRKELLETDVKQFDRRLRQLAPFDQSIALAFEDKPRPNNAGTIVTTFISERLGVWTGKKDESMVRYWSVLAGGVNGGIMDDLLYMRKLAFLYKLNNAQKESFDKIYMKIAFEGDRESRLEVSIGSLESDDPMIDISKVKKYLQRRTAWLRGSRDLSDKELSKLPAFEHALYKLKDCFELMDPVDMPSFFIDWRRLCSGHTDKNIKKWASGFNFMALHPHHVFSNDVNTLFSVQKLTRRDSSLEEQGDWFDDFEKGDLKKHVFLRYLESYMYQVFGLGAD